MAPIAQRLIGKLGMTVGVVVIAGSVVGGVALAADLGRAGEAPDSSVPVSDDGAATPDGAASTVGPGATALETAATAPTGATSPAAQPTTVPEATPTCWSGPGERPDGIEKCEDD